MGKLDSEPEIIRLAQSLGSDSDHGPVAYILQFCRGKIEEFLLKSGPVSTLDQLQSVVCQHLRLAFEEVRTTADFDRIEGKYAHIDPVFASIGTQLTDEVFAVLIRRNDTDSEGMTQWVAVIDCRGEKHLRRYFTRWHEAAHVLTGVTNIRAIGNDDPLEKLMDHVAGEVGFYEPLLLPTLREELVQSGRLTFDGIDRIKSALCPTASFHSMLIACAKRSSIPSLVVEAKLAYRAEEERIRNDSQGQLFAEELPIPKLRAVNSSRNQAATSAKLTIHKNMSIPSGSAIFKHFQATGKAESASEKCCVDENLSIWRTSDGKVMGFGVVRVEAKRISETTVLALIQKGIFSKPKPTRTRSDSGSR